MEINERDERTIQSYVIWKVWPIQNGAEEISHPFTYFFKDLSLSSKSLKNHKHTLDTVERNKIKRES